MGGPDVRHLLLPDNFDTNIPKWAVHASASRSMALGLWLLGALRDAPAVPAVPELRDSEADPRLGRSGPQLLPHRYGQGVRRQLFGDQSREDLESLGHFRAGTLSRLGLQGDSDTALGDPLGDQSHVGGDRDRVHASLAELRRVLVGRLDTGCSHLQRLGDLGGIEDLLDPRNEGIQVGQYQGHREHNGKTKEGRAAIHSR